MCQPIPGPMMESQTKTSSSVFWLVVYSQASNLGEETGVGRQSKRSDLLSGQFTKCI